LQRSDFTDGENGCFRFLVNGTEIMCKGTNWVPLDAFHSRDKARYAEALALVKDIGCNIVRCWGGNVYEADEFFDFCDRNGIMVWQDFAMGCRWYPQDDAFAATISKEVESVVRRLRNHPSLILWAGDNEIDIMAADTRNPEENRLTRRVIPAVVAANDSTRPYLPSSPYMSPAVYESRGKLEMPENHIWGPRDYFKSEYYRNQKAHFVSETGYHGCPAPESIKKFIEPEYIWPYNNKNPQWILHSSDQEGNEARTLLMANQIKVLFGEIPDNLDDFAAASQISQAEAKKYFIERMRTGRPQKTGIIWWNLLDGWPQMSDAIVDYYFTRKKAYDYVKRTQAPFAVLAADSGDGLDIFACNDTLAEKQGVLEIFDAESDDLLGRYEFTAGINAASLITHIAVDIATPKMLIFKWSVNGEQGFGHHLCFAPPISYKWYKALMEKHGL
ncbi:MAG: glycoside hydrolase family 2, partial [Clostridia bacterium]|nr:glycoside hydrolase family 2 [Clostridia bacterium]